MLVFAQNPSVPGYKPPNRIIKNDKPDAVLEPKLHRIDLVGIHIERAYANKNTIAFSVNSEFLLPYLNRRSLRFAFGLLPKLEIANRHYYSIARRKKMGKAYQYNTGPYVAGKLEVQQLVVGFQPSFNEFTAAVAGVVWGYQNNVEPMSINFELGLGLGFVRADLPEIYLNGVPITILSKLTFGFLLNK